MRVVRCSLLRGNDVRMKPDERSNTCRIECVVDPSGDFTGGRFTFLEIQLGGFEVGTVFNSLFSKRKYTITKTGIRKGWQEE